MQRFLGALVAISFTSVSASAQSGQGSLNGYVKDEQGGVLPGVTVTAAGPEILAPVVAVTDSAGFYRLQNIPPGIDDQRRAPGLLIVQARRDSHARGQHVHRRHRDESRRARRNGHRGRRLADGLDRCSDKTLTVEGDLLRAAPISSRRAFSDVLDMAPGVNSRNSDGASGQRILLSRHDALRDRDPARGQPAAPNDGAAFQIDMGTETIADAEVKLGGVDASSPTGTSVVMNILAARRQRPEGSVQDEGAKFDWNSDNTQNSVAPGGTPTSQSVNQWDVALGGPIRKNKIWAFGAYRYSDLGIGVSRLPLDLQFLTTFRPDFVPFNNTRKGNQQFAKVTTQASSNHEITAFYQYQHAKNWRTRTGSRQISCTDSGGGLYCAAECRDEPLTTSISGRTSKGGNSLTRPTARGRR
jgi:hypothetical protein